MTTAATAGKADKECPICLEVKPIAAFMVGGYEKRGCNVCTYLPNKNPSGKSKFRIKKGSSHAFVDYYDPKLHELSNKVDNKGEM